MSGTHVDIILGRLGHLRAILAQFWAYLGPPWVPLVAVLGLHLISWGHPGIILAILNPSTGSLGHLETYVALGFIVPIAPT